METEIITDYVFREVLEKYSIQKLYSAVTTTKIDKIVQKYSKEKMRKDSLRISQTEKANIIPLSFLLVVGFTTLSWETTLLETYFVIVLVEMSQGENPAS